MSKSKPKKVPLSKLLSTVTTKKSHKTRVKRSRGKARPGLVKQMTQKEVRQLQKQWYDVLRADGFRDLETFKVDHGFNDWLNNQGSQAPARIAMAYNTETETYYRRLTNYITHNPNWCNDHMYHLIGKMYIVGVSYRKMLPHLADKGYKTNIWRVHHVVKLLVKKAFAWNKSHPEGLDFDPDLDYSYKLKQP